MFKYFLYWLSLCFVRTFPRRVCMRVADWIGDLYYLFSRKSKRAVRSNLARVLGKDPSSPEVVRASRRTFRNFGKYLADFFIGGVKPVETLLSFVTIHGLENVGRALERGKGAILLSAHLGNWELGGMLIAASGYPVTAVALAHEQARVNELFNAQRRAKGMNVVPVDSAALRACFRALRRNECVAMLGDRDTTSAGVEEEFFGERTLVPKGPAAIAVATGCGVVPGCLVRERDDRCALIIDEPLFPPGGPSEEAEAVMRRMLLRKIEDYIRRWPDQWFLFYPVWEREGGPLEGAVAR